MKMRITLTGVFLCSVFVISVVSGQRLKQDVRRLKLETELLQHDYLELKQHIVDVQEMQDYLNSSMWQCKEDSLNAGLYQHVKNDAKTLMTDPLELQGRIEALLNGFADVKMSMEKRLDRFSSQMNGLLDIMEKHEAKLSTMEENFTRYVEITLSLEDRLEGVSSQMNGVLETQEKLDAKLAMVDEKQHDFEQFMIANLTSVVEVVQSLSTFVDIIQGGGGTTSIRTTISTTAAGVTVTPSTPLVPDVPDRDCKDVFDKGKGTTSGVYTVTLPKTGKQVPVYCDMETAGGGWTVLQRRFDGSVEFFRNFSDYENGFGNIEDGEFWLGLSTVHEMTFNTTSELRLDLEDAAGMMADITFGDFILTPGPKYVLKISKGTGSIVDRIGLSYNNKRPFSTYDRDLTDSRSKCPEKDRGGWWYSNCAYANLNGQYVTPGTLSEYNRGEGGMTYRAFADFKSLKSSEMMFRREK